MLCTDFDSLLCDYIDGTLESARVPAFEEHKETCASCAELARDAAAAVRFIAVAETPEPPPELITRIAFEIPSGAVRKGWRSALLGWIHPVLQPRFAMGMAMTLLSFSMLGRFAGIEVRQLKLSDLQPSAVWAAIDNRIHRGWERGVKYYENLRLVYEVQARLQQWTEQEDEERKAQGQTSPAQTKELPGSEGK